MNAGSSDSVEDGAPSAQGPAWTPYGLQIAGGRFPLSVEAHLLAMTGRLVPGATTVTTNARYYSIHGLVAVEAERRGLDAPDALELLRRCEVVFGAAALLADDGIGPQPHGAGPLQVAIERDALDVAALSEPGKGGYSEARQGFWGPYIGSEIALGILDPTDPTRPGPRSEPSALRTGLDGLVETAERDTVAVDELRGLGHLGLDASARSDGQWLLELFTNPGLDVEALRETDSARNATISLLLAAVEAGPARTFATSFRDFVAFSDRPTQHPATEGLAESDAWRGVIMRWYSVGAWRRLWQWLVAQMEGQLLETRQLATMCADLFPDGTVHEFVNQLPAIERGGVPVAAEESVRQASEPVPVKELQVLMIGGLRTTNLQGRARDAFAGRYTALSPEWMRTRVEESLRQPLRTFVADLVHELVRRSQRIAMKKARLRPGGLWIPTRVYERDGLLIRTSPEGGGDVGLRIDQLGGILAALGVFEQHDSLWRLTEIGADLARSAR